MGQNVKDLVSGKEAILFDMDGTLVQSNELHASAWAEVLERFGHDIPAEQVWPLIGKGGDKLLPELTGIEEDSEEGQKISDARSKVFIEHYAPRVKAISQVRELLQYLTGQGKKIVIATSASEDELHAILQASGLEDSFPDMTSSDDADVSKPDPDIIVAALQKVGVPAERALMIGDTPYDIEAANRAGIDILAFRCGGWSDEDFDGATAICEGPEELLSELTRAPNSSALQPSPQHGEAAL
jgi:HAD superfamily hydrolase (TIGR01509 family)